MVCTYIGLYYYLMMDYSQIDLMLTCACQQNQTSGVKPWFMSHKIYYRISGYGSLITVKKSSKIWQGWVKVCGCPWIWLSECFHQFTLSWSCPWLYKHVHMSGVPGISPFLISPHSRSASKLLLPVGEILLQVLV